MSCKPVVVLDEDTLRGKPVDCIEVLKKELVLIPEDRPIHPIEAAHLLYRGAGEVRLGTRRVSFEELLALYAIRNPLALAYYEVYLELRRRGRLPVPGPRDNTLILVKSRRSPKQTHYILVLEEGRPVRVAQLALFVEEARKKNLEPVLAIVDRYGDVTFYTPMVFHPAESRVKGAVEESLEAQGQPRPA